MDINKKRIQNLNKVNAYMIKHLPGFADAIKLVLKKASNIAKSIISFLKKLFFGEKLHEAENDNFISKKIGSKLQNIVLMLIKPFFTLAIGFSKNLAYAVVKRDNVLEEDNNDNKSYVFKAILILFLAMFTENLLAMVVQKIIMHFRSQDLDAINTAQESISKPIMLLMGLLFAPIVEETARAISIRVSNRKSFAFTIAIMILENIHQTGLVFYRNTERKHTLFTTSRGISIVVASRFVHMMLHKVHLTNFKYSAVLAMVIHSIYNYFAFKFLDKLI